MKLAVNKMVWFWSDLHIGHEGILTYQNRPFPDLQQMEDRLVYNYNSVVKPGDISIWVGDIVFGSAKKGESFFKRLNPGIKILVEGNHEARESQQYRLGFNFVCRKFTMKIAGEVVHVSHYPWRYTAWQTFVRTLRGEKRPRFEWRRVVNDGNWIIHGHTHENTFVNAKARMIHVGVDAHDYKPVPITRIASEIMRVRDGQSARI